jgi:hypothetical protein
MAPFSSRSGSNSLSQRRQISWLVVWQTSRHLQQNLNIRIGIVTIIVRIGDQRSALTAIS